MKKILFSTMALVGLLAFAALSIFAQERADYSPTLEPYQGNPADVLNLVISADDTREISETTAADVSNLACDTSNCVYLPISISAPELNAGAVFHKNNCASDYTATSIDNNGSVSLSSGQRQITFGILAEGYAGSAYETRFLINGAVAGVNSGTVITDREPILSLTYTYGIQGTTGCREVIPAGVSTVEFWIDGQKVTQLTANLN
ncbi:MAG: hypothetical protein AAGD96_23775 [Chloroflexota bacterium]